MLIILLFCLAFSAVPSLDDQLHFINRDFWRAITDSATANNLTCMVQPPLYGTYVQCTVIYVTSVVVREDALGGSLPDGLALVLPGLQKLAVGPDDTSMLHGSLPLLPPSLWYLTLEHHDLTGRLPDPLPPTLRHLFVRGNRLSGTLPALPSSLTKIRIDINAFSGSLEHVNGVQIEDCAVINTNQLDESNCFNPCPFQNLSFVCTAEGAHREPCLGDWNDTCVVVTGPPPPPLSSSPTLAPTAQPTPLATTTTHTVPVSSTEPIVDGAPVASADASALTLIVIVCIGAVVLLLLLLMVAFLLTRSRRQRRHATRRRSGAGGSSARGSVRGSRRQSAMMTSDDAASRHRMTAYDASTTTSTTASASHLARTGASTASGSSSYGGGSGASILPSTQLFVSNPYGAFSGLAPTNSYDDIHSMLQSSAGTTMTTASYDRIDAPLN